jgi:hypothetical protein
MRVFTQQRLMLLRRSSSRCPDRSNQHHVVRPDIAHRSTQSVRCLQHRANGFRIFCQALPQGAELLLFR